MKTLVQVRSTLPLVLALGIMTVSAAVADLPSRGWPQARRDARLTARGLEPALTDPHVAWARRVGLGLEGEPAILDCDLWIASQGGEVIAVNARSGQRAWRSIDADIGCGGAVPSPSALAIDESGSLAAGLAADAALIALAEALCRIRRAIEGYAIDNNDYPPAGDIEAQIAPTYIASWPENPCTGGAMIESDEVSAGDLRYSRDGPGEYHLAGWWSDGGVVGDPRWCGSEATGSGGPDPAWPASETAAGSARVLDAGSGDVAWRVGEETLSTAFRPSLRPEGVAWAGDAAALESELARGRLLATDPDGAVLWEHRSFGGARGSAARDEATGELFLAWRPENTGPIFNAQARTLGAAAEGHAIDYGEYPPTGELADLIVPTYLRDMPANVYTGEPMRWSPTASAGDYDYASPEPDRQTFELSVWNRFGERANLYSDGSFLSWAENEPTTRVEAFTAAGEWLWQRELDASSSDGAVEPTSVVLLPDAAGRPSVVGGSDRGEAFAFDPNDGADRWRIDVGVPLTGEPAVLADGGVAFVAGAARDRLVVIDPPPTGVRFVHDAGAELVAAPSVTADDVVLLADAAGRVRAVRANGDLAWVRDVGEGVALTTPVVTSEGWAYVGRADGVLLALVEGPDGMLPAWPGGLLGVRRGTGASETVLAWPDTALPDEPGAHYHVARWLGRPTGAPEQVVPTHDATARSFADATPGESLACYRLRVADCGENERGGER